MPWRILLINRMSVMQIFDNQSILRQLGLEVLSRFTSEVSFQCETSPQETFITGRVVTQAVDSPLTKVSVLWLYIDTDSAEGPRLSVWSANCLGLSQLCSRTWKVKLK